METVRALATAGARVILTARSAAAGEKVAQELKASGVKVHTCCACMLLITAVPVCMAACAPVPPKRGAFPNSLPPAQGDIVVKQLDLADLASVKRFAEDFQATERGPHLLILNAGEPQLHDASYAQPMLYARC